MIQAARKTKWHKSTGREVEVIIRYGEIVRCRVIETGKVTSFHPSSLVGSYAETKPARVAVAELKSGIKERRERLRRKTTACKCGRKKGQRLSSAKNASVQAER